MQTADPPTPPLYVDVAPLPGDPESGFGNAAAAEMLLEAPSSQILSRWVMQLDYARRGVAAHGDFILSPVPHSHYAAVITKPTRNIPSTPEIFWPPKTADPPSL